MIRNQAWRTQAACIGRSASLWFPEGGAGNGIAAQEAVRICHTCPVSIQCAEHALVQPEHYGIWGGITAEERKNLLGMVRCGTTAGYARHQRTGSRPCQSCLNAIKRRPRDRTNQENHG